MRRFRTAAPLPLAPAGRVGGRETAARHGADDGQFAGQGDHRANLSELAGLAGTDTSEHAEAFLRRRQVRAPSDGANNQVGQGHRSVQVAVTRDLDASQRCGGLGNAGHVLPAGDKECRQRIGNVALQADSPGLDGAVGRLSPGARGFLGRGPPVAPVLASRENDLGTGIASPGRAEGHRRGPLVPGQHGLDQPAGWCDRGRFQQLPAGGLRGRGDHVLPGRIAGRELEQQVDRVADDVRVHVEEPAVARGTGGGRRDQFLLRRQPGRKPAGLLQRSELEARRALHLFAAAERRRTAAAVHRVEGMLVGRYQRALAGCERDEKFALGRSAMDSHGSRDPKRDARESNESFDAALEGGRVDRRAYAGDLVDLAALLAQPILTCLNGLGRAVGRGGQALRRPVGRAVGVWRVAHR